MNLNPYRNAWLNAFDFSGRASRAEFWQFSLINNGLAIVAMIGLMWPAVSAELDGAAYELSSAMIFGYVILGVFIIATIIPNLSVTVRRLHDTGRSGFWILAGFIPGLNYITAFILLYFYLQSSDGPNKYGEPPDWLGNMTLIGRGDLD